MCISHLPTNKVNTKKIISSVFCREILHGIYLSHSLFLSWTVRNLHCLMSMWCTDYLLCQVRNHSSHALSLLFDYSCVAKFPLSVLAYVTQLLFVEYFIILLSRTRSSYPECILGKIDYTSFRVTCKILKTDIYAWCCCNYWNLIYIKKIIKCWYILIYSIYLQQIIVKWWI